MSQINDFSLDDILELLEEEESQSRKRSYREMKYNQNGESISIGFMTANEYQQQEKKKDHLQLEELRLERQQKKIELN